MKKIIIVNGPNLNLLGRREPEIYGSVSFKQYFDEVLVKVSQEVELHYFQSNHEGALIDKLHEVGYTYHGIILNGGAFTHYSLAIADAVAAIGTPVIEVHISNIYAREAFRAKSLTAVNAIGTIAGLGLNGYRLALDHLLRI